MIYKNGIKVTKIELLIEDKITCHLHLSNGKVFTGIPNTADPSIMHNKNKLELFTVRTIATTLQNLQQELENDD
jgi:hypothetical protein